MVAVQIDLDLEDSSIVDIALNLTIDEVDPYLLGVHAVLTGGLAFCSVLLHVFVFFVFISKRKHLSKEEILSFTAILGNFLVIFFHSSTVPLSASHRRWLFGEFGCAVSASFYVIGTDLRYSSLVALSIQRFGTVIFPRGYKKKSGEIISLLIIVIFVHLLVSRIWYLYTAVIFFDVTWPSCDAQTSAEFDSSPATIVRQTLFAVYLSTGAIPLVFYLILSRKVYKIRNNAIGVLQNNSSRSNIEVSNDSELNNSSEDNTESNNRSERNKVDGLKREKKKMLLLFLLLLYGVIISYSKSTSGSIEFALGNPRRAIFIHFVLTILRLSVPPLDIAYLILSSPNLKKAFYEVLRVIENYLLRYSGSAVRRITNYLK